MSSRCGRAAEDAERVGGESAAEPLSASSVRTLDLEFNHLGFTLLFDNTVPMKSRLEVRKVSGTNV